MKTASKRKHLYEGMYIMRSTLSDDAKTKAISKVTSLIEGLGGSIEKMIDWGRRKMAYEIKGCRDGHYHLIYFSLPTDSIDELIRENHLHEDLLRFLHVAIEEVPEGNEIKFKSIVQVERSI